MYRTLYTRWKDGSVCEIALLQNEFVEQWCDHHVRLKRHLDFLPRVAMYGYQAHAPDDKIAMREYCVDRINGAIDDLAEIGIHYPYRASLEMDFAECNKLHRAFTTAAASERKFVLENTPLEFFRSYKRCEFSDKLHYLFRHEPRWFEVNMSEDPERFSEFLRCIHIINMEIHNYEESLVSRRAVEMQEAYGTTLRHIEVEWQSYTADGEHKMKITDPITREHKKRFCSLSPENNVYLVKSILGKDYLTCYMQYDDPGWWDITNLEWSNGGFAIDKHCIINQLLNSPRIRHWLQTHGVHRAPEIIAPMPLGRVVNREWLDRWDWIDQRPPLEGEGGPRPVDGAYLVETELV